MGSAATAWVGNIVSRRTNNEVDEIWLEANRLQQCLGIIMTLITSRGDQQDKSFITFTHLSICLQQYTRKGYCSKQMMAQRSRKSRKNFISGQSTVWKAGAANQKQHNVRDGTKSGTHPMMWSEGKESSKQVASMGGLSGTDVRMKSW